MIRSLIFAFALSTSLVAFGSGPAYAQTTEQTDQSEEDWRKSRKKRDASDIFEDITNSRNTGWGITQGPANPVDSLPEDSRRHLMRERARVIANTNPGEPARAEYKPSEAAKSDPDLEAQEKEAWDVIVTDLKGGGTGTAPSGEGGPNKIAIAGQGGGQGDNQNDGQRGNSAIRGGSTQSVAEILAQIKGMQSAAGTGGGGSSPTQGPTGLGRQPGTQDMGGQPSGRQGEGQNPDHSEGQNLGQGRGQLPGQNSTKNQQVQDGSASNDSDSASNAADGAQAQNGDQSQEAHSESSSQSQTQFEAQSEAYSHTEGSAEAQALTEAAADSKAPSEPIGPLERIKNQSDRNSSGTRTSASDYLKKSD